MKTLQTIARENSIVGVRGEEREGQQFEMVQRRGRIQMRERA